MPNGPFAIAMPFDEIAADPAELARRYGRLVFASAYRLLGDAAAAEDVQQDVFVRLLERTPAGVTSWPAYLRASAARAAIDRLRKLRRWRRLLPMLRALRDDAPPADAATLSAQRARALREAIALLPKREAECFVLRHLEGLDGRSVAAALDITENHVGVLLHRAVRRLTQSLADFPSLPE
ncbi:MAG TPA: sigma-70 family RNA polymerase sigma factor [Xanthomonadales bacterium]|nr:sigma-70 family RNA polymerase sigma factor [Xanthomonadales bacterium]